MLRLLILLLFTLVLIAPFSSLHPHLRVILAAVLLLVVLWGFLSGQLHSQAPW